MGAERFGVETQKIFVEMLLSDQDLMDRCRDIMAPELFDVPLQDPVRAILDHVDKYRDIPDLDIVNSQSEDYQFDRRKRKFVARQTAWFLDEFEAFCRNRKMQGALVDGSRKIGGRDEAIGEIAQSVRDAEEIGLAKNLGIDYFKDGKGRLERIRDVGDRTSTGWTEIDRTLHGGFHKGELNIFAGASGAGKSLFLQNLALNWVFMGLNVVFVTLELSEDLCSLRLDSMISGTPMSQIVRNIEDVLLSIEMERKRAKKGGTPFGGLRIVKMPSGVTSNSIRAFMKECEVRGKMKIDAVIVDYMGLMEPSRRVSMNRDNAFNNDKYVSEELRDLAVEADVLFATASQLNREAIGADDYNHSHIAGGISKINTADNVIYIVDKDVGEGEDLGTYTVKFVKTRSSSGEGRYVDLDYGAVSLRIGDFTQGPGGGTTDQGSVVSRSYARKAEKVAANPAARKNASKDDDLNSERGGMFGKHGDD